MKNTEIEMREDTPGKWEVRDLNKHPHEAWKHTVDNIPRLGSPVTFFAAILAAVLISYLI